ncbi:hypothetical protein R3W88_029369 [Solanum pinnatisectum]|uniref:Uncharacterized protein n=1 Tax=Solanum pinnatisectum TaxID=50273 RepID=A0AAV9K5D9_9SOLN|nr:hypothetical protein R3W88_029369 [Solanum pinnatisectum]
MAPMRIYLRPSVWKGKVPFRFFNVWAGHVSFLSMVHEHWTQAGTKGMMENVWNKLKGLQPQFKQLNMREFRGVSHRIIQARTDLVNVQQSMASSYSESLQELEKILVQNLEKWSLIEESIVQQKARAHWIRLEDSFVFLRYSERKSSQDANFKA